MCIICHPVNFKLPNDSIDIKKDPIKIPIASEFGKKDFLVPYEKHHYNIEQSSDKRGMHSYLLKVSPLNADSIGYDLEEPIWIL